MMLNFVPQAIFAKGTALIAVSLVGFCACGMNTQAAPQPKSTRSGLYQFAYEEKGATIKPRQYIELHPDGRWTMYRLPLTSGLRAPQVPLKGTYKISGQKITFHELKPARAQSGPGVPSPVETARFQGKDFFIISMADHIVISQSAKNARYVKIR